MISIIKDQNVADIEKTSNHCTMAWRVATGNTFPKGSNELKGLVLRDPQECKCTDICGPQCLRLGWTWILKDFDDCDYCRYQSYQSLYVQKNCLRFEAMEPLYDGTIFEDLPTKSN